MILFVFEGSRREPKLFESIKELFFPKEVDSFICTYKCNIYHLYSRIKEYDIFDDSTSVDTVSILKEILSHKHDNTLANINSADISEIYLFFDYDFHHHPRTALQEDNCHIEELLSFFNEETENGKLYINYPMIESIRYTKTLPDTNYINYVISREDCYSFKNLANKFSSYSSLDYLLVSSNEKEDAKKKIKRFKKAKENWQHLIYMNVTKANYICHNNTHYPASKSDISQIKIFKAQLQKHVYCNDCRIAILNSFPIFIYEYLKI